MRTDGRRSKGFHNVDLAPVDLHLAAESVSARYAHLSKLLLSSTLQEHAKLWRLGKEFQLVDIGFSTLRVRYCNGRQ